MKKTEGNQLIETGTLFQEYGFNGDPVYSNKPFIISNLAEGYYQLYLNADYNNNRICEISVNYLGFEENIKNLFYEGFEGFLSSGIQPFAGEGCCMGNYTVPFLKPDNQKYYVDYRTYGGGKWTFKKDIYTDNMRLYGQAIDEVRVYPENAQISSFTYKPLVGISSDTDPSGRTVFYIYDHFGRLQCVKDENGNILNDYQYNYKH